jgi:hypothetical protein
MTWHSCGGNADVRLKTARKLNDMAQPACPFNNRYSSRSIGIYSPNMKGTLPDNPIHNAVIYSDYPTSRKPTTDDWEVHRGKIIELYIDEKRSLSDIQNRLRQDHDFATT